MTLTARPRSSQVIPNNGPCRSSGQSLHSSENQEPEESLDGRHSARVVPEQDEFLTETEDCVQRTIYQVKTLGWIGAKQNIMLYLRMMVPVTIVCAWMFIIYATLSWTIPHLLCKHTIDTYSGSSLGLPLCVYVSDGQYGQYTASKVFWLIYWAIQTTWMACFPAFISKALFGSCVSRFQGLVAFATGACCVTASLVPPLVYQQPLNNYIVLVATTLGSLLVTIVCSGAAVRYTNDPLMRWRWILLFLFAGQVQNFYLFVMPKIITARSQDALGGMGLTVIRLFVHPIIWAVVLFYFRTIMRHIGRIKDLTQACFLVWPVLYSSLYGRFLLLQLNSVGSIIVVNFMMSCFQIAGELNDRGSDDLWLGLLYGRRAIDALQSVRDVDEMELLSQLTGNMMEVASIVASSALLSFGGIANSPGIPPDHAAIWYQALVQLATQILFNFVEVVASGKFHCIEWQKVYPRSTIRLLAYIFIVLTIGGSRLCIEILLLFCPRRYSEYGILLEECDTPSLFQAISFSLSRRTTGTVIGRMLNITQNNLNA